MNDIWLYSLLPAPAAVWCMLLLIKLYNKRAPMHYLKLFINLMLMNVVQATCYIAFSFSLVLAHYLADIYLITAYFFFTHLLMTSLHLANSPVPSKQLNILYVFPILLTLFHIAGLMVESYRIENSALLHNDGPLAWCLDIYILFACFASVGIFWRNVKRCAEDRMKRSKNILALISFVPLVMVFVTIVLLSTTQYAIPVAVIGPAITFYTALAFYYVARERVVDVSIGLRFFIGRLKLAYKLLETHKTKYDLKEFNQEIDKQFIQEALEECDYNIQATADYLKVNHTTLRNKIKAYRLSSGGTYSSSRSAYND